MKFVWKQFLGLFSLTYKLSEICGKFFYFTISASETDGDLREPAQLQNYFI